jgi:hypothetical protein
MGERLPSSLTARPARQPTAIELADEARRREEENLDALYTDRMEQIPGRRGFLRQAPRPDVGPATLAYAAERRKALAAGAPASYPTPAPAAAPPITAPPAHVSGQREKAAGEHGQASAVAEHEAIRMPARTAPSAHGEPAIMRAARERGDGALAATRQRVVTNLGDRLAVEGLRSRQFRPEPIEELDENGWGAEERAAMTRLQAAGPEPRIQMALRGSAAQEEVDGRARSRIQQRYEAEREATAREAKRNDPMQRSLDARAKTLAYERMLPAGSESSLSYKDPSRGVGDWKAADQMNDWNRDGKGEMGRPTIAEDMQYGREDSRRRSEQAGRERAATANTRFKLGSAADIEMEFEQRAARLDAQMKAGKITPEERNATLARMERRKRTLLEAVDALAKEDPDGFLREEPQAVPSV